jgi:hypothetical protein
MRFAETCFPMVRRQGSGHTFWGTEWHPSNGFNGNTDGDRTKSYDEYRQT